MKIAGVDVRDREEDYININPLQTAGRSNSESRKAVLSYVDGYSVCDWCKGDLCSIEKPPVKRFLDEVSEFLGMDETILTNGCREAKYIALKNLCEKGDAVVVDSNKHYTTYVAAERCGLDIHEVPSNGEPEYAIDPDDFAKTFDDVRKETGKLPKACVLTHVDGSYGNVVDAEKVGEICGEYGIPYILNTAYSSGRMPVDGKKFGADFLAVSCHKSWGAGGGNIGLLATTDEYSDKVFRKSSKYPVKPLEILGCSTRGAQTISLMAGYAAVKERVNMWAEEVEKAQYLMSEFEDIGLAQLGVKPTEHDVNFIVSDVLYEISKTHKKKNFFLYNELKQRGVMGIKAGLTKNFKMSTYGKTWEQIKHLGWAFRDIIEKCGN